jgi:hypothetical protein
MRSGECWPAGQTGFHGYPHNPCSVVYVQTQGYFDIDGVFNVEHMRQQVQVVGVVWDDPASLMPVPPANMPGYTP